jgi:hypothetical protein
MFATTLSVVATKSSLERATRIELAFSNFPVPVHGLLWMPQLRQ